MLFRSVVLDAFLIRNWGAKGNFTATTQEELLEADRWLDGTRHDGLLAEFLDEGCPALNLSSMTRA